MLLALATSSAVPCAMTRNLSDLSAVSYCMMLSLGIPMLYSPAPNALKPADDHGAFQCSDNPAHQRAKHDEGTDAWD